jgi:glutamyl-Q tRNA(Asp) synthetase
MAQGKGSADEAEGRRVFRFAPSPNGFLHLGHAYSALFNRKLARAAGGELLLRIEDIDSQRSREIFETALREDLSWLGFRWDGTPRRQSEHLPAYRAALDSLVARGLAYPCFCSRSDVARAAAAKTVAARDPDGALLYLGTCRDMPASERAARKASGTGWALRLDMARALACVPADLAYREFREGDDGIVMRAKPELWGDVVIGRRDAAASYHLACVLDDHKQGVTDVVRGVDLEAATGLHRLLQALFGLRTPDYHHHRLVLDSAGRKLSKSASSPSLRELREKGATAEAIRAELSQVMGVAL